MDRLTRRFADAGRALRTLQEALQMVAPTALDESETIRALAMAEDRNRTVHAYIEAVAAQIHSRLGPYAALMQTMIGRMEGKLT